MLSLTDLFTSITTREEGSYNLTWKEYKQAKEILSRRRAR